MKPGPHVIEIRDGAGNLYRKAIGPVGCLGVLEKAAQAAIKWALWFGLGLLVGYLWNG